MKSRITSPTFAAAGLLLLTFACQGDEKRADDEAGPLPDSPVDQAPVQAQSSTMGLIDVKAEITADGLRLEIKNVPEGATLGCNLNETPLPCHEGEGLFARPALGTHKVSAVATKDGSVVALGESKPFKVERERITSRTPDEEGEPLALSLVNDDFANGGVLTVGKSYTFRFELAGDPGCKAELSCAYGDERSAFWIQCAENDAREFALDGELMAMGRQTLQVKAQCEGRAGPTLKLHWYGVGEGYQPLALGSVSDPQGQHFLYLIKSDDCPLSQLGFECAEADAEEWALCPLANAIESPAKGFRARAVCDGRAGPEHVLVP